MCCQPLELKDKMDSLYNVCCYNLVLSGNFARNFKHKVADVVL
jgi:hypothetical protein